MNHLFACLAFALPLPAFAQMSEADARDLLSRAFLDFEIVSEHTPTEVRHQVNDVSIGETWRVDHAMGKFIGTDAPYAINVRQVIFEVRASDLQPILKLSEMSIAEDQTPLFAVVLRCKQGDCVTQTTRDFAGTGPATRPMELIAEGTDAQTITLDHAAFLFGDYFSAKGAGEALEALRQTSGQ